MSTYLEINANKYANNNIHVFDKKIKLFNKINGTIHLNNKECQQVYEKYKIDCQFDKLIQISILFENDKKMYNDIDTRLNYAIEKDVFQKIYKSCLGNIYNRLFKKTYNKLSLIEKIDDSNEQIQQLANCIDGRIQYHYHCRLYTKKYNEKNHMHEILYTIYMFNRIKDIQKLLNKFKHKHILFKERLQREIEEKQREIEEKQREMIDFDNMTTESSTLSDPFIDVNNSKRHKPRRKS